LGGLVDQPDLMRSAGALKVRSCLMVTSSGGSLDHLVGALERQ
jgi:hypothetical protein